MVAEGFLRCMPISKFCGENVRTWSRASSGDFVSARLDGSEGRFPASRLVAAARIAEGSARSRRTSRPSLADHVRKAVYATSLERLVQAECLLEELQAR